MIMEQNSTVDTISQTQGDIASLSRPRSIHIFKTACCISDVTYERGLAQLSFYSMHMNHRYVWD